MKKNLVTRIFKGALALLLAFSVVETSAFTKVSALDVVADSKIADTDTSDEWREYFINNTQTTGTISTGNAGYVWSDKTVLTTPNTELSSVGINITDDSNFLVEMSAMSANREVVGYSTIPTDTMLVLDLSNSMSEDDMYAMVKAVNAAMDKLLKLNNENRVGIAVYDTDASVLLPLDRYTTTKINNNGTTNTTDDDYPEYIELIDFKRNNNANSGTIRASKNTVTTTQTVTISFNNVRWTNLRDSINDINTGYNQNTYVSYVAYYLQYYLSSYIPNGVTVDWNALARENRDGQNGRWKQDWETFIKSKLGTVTTTTTTESNVVKDSEGDEVTYSVSIGGGTYMQAGLWQAWKQFEAVDDVVVPDGILAGTKRMPVMVLMTDGAPTYTTLNYNNVAGYNSNISGGSSSSANARNAFLTQLTASWVKEKMAEKYDGDSLFYTLGLGVGDNDIATSVMDPMKSTTAIDNYWTTYLNAANNANVQLRLDNDTRTVKRDTTVKTQDYVKEYFEADDADEMIEAFDDIVDAIILQSKYYPTLASSKNFDLDGFMTFTDKIGEYMEVKNIKGLLAGSGDERKLYSGSAFANAIETGIFGQISGGNMNNLDEDGEKMIKAIQTRLGCTEDQAKAALQYAISNDQVYYNSATDYSNYMAWYGDANGKFVAVWDGKDGSTPSGAVYRIKDYGFFGSVGSEETFTLTDMSYVIVQVMENIATGQETIVWKVPTSLIPVMEYEVSFDGNSYDTATNIEMNVIDAEPIRLVYEVGVKAEINEYNISEIVADDYRFKNEDGSYTFYTNLFNYDDYNVTTGEDGNSATEMTFEPSMENERYYYTKDTYVLDADYNKVKSVNDNGKYNYEVVHFNRKSDGTVDLIRYHSEISSSKLTSAVTDSEGYLYIPKGTPFGRLTSGAEDMVKSVNATESLGYFNYPVIYRNDGSEYSGKTYLGNNGRVSINPKTGIKLSKVIENIAANTTTDFEFVIELFDANGSAVNGTFDVVRFAKDGTQYPATTVTSSNGQFTVTLSEGEYAYIADLVAGTRYTVTEKYNEYYSVKEVQVNGLVQNTNASYNATGVLVNNEFDSVVVENALTVEGLLTITKDVEYPFDVTAEQIANGKSFTIHVDLGSKYANREIEKTDGSKVMVDANGVVTVTLKDGESVSFKLDEGDGYTITESNLPNGYTMNATASQNITGTVTAEGVTATVVNTYNPGKVKPVNLEVSGNKTLTGREWLAEDEFNFLLQEFDGSNWNTISIVDGDKSQATKDDTTFNFSNTVQAFEFNEIGKYYYRIVEVNGGEKIAGVTYDSTVYDFVVSVTDADLDGKLEIASVTSPSNIVKFENDVYTIDVTYANTYAPSGNSEVIITINKQVTNDTDVEVGKDGYEFVLLNLDGTVAATSNATTVDGVTTIELAFNVDFLGENKYQLMEVIPTNTIDGMVYDERIRDVVINVVDNLDGTLGATVTIDGTEYAAENATVSFNNVYDEETHVFTGNKVLSGREWIDGDTFSFELYETGSDFDETAADAQKLGTEVVTFADASKAFTFDEITYKNVGTHYYVIKEVAGTIGGITYDSQEYRATVTLTRDDNNQLVKTVTFVDGEGNTAQSAVFTNTYKASETSIELGGTKTMDGRDMFADEFTFNLFAVDAQGNVATTPLDTVTNVEALSGVKTSFKFEEQTYTQAGTYVYAITETKGTAGGVTYDETTYLVTVTVTDNNEGSLVAEVTSITDAQGVTKNSVAFLNTYKTSDTELVINGTKTLNGRDMNANEFTFNLYETDESYSIDGLKPIQTATNVAGANGEETTFAFASVPFKEAGEYYYVVTEEKGTLGGITYDQTKYDVKVVVKDNLNGTLTASVVSVNGKEAGKVAFVNTYKANVNASVVLDAQKDLQGRDWKDSDQFTFELYTADEEYNVTANAEAFRTLTVTDETVKAFEEITYDTVGTYYYVMKETNGGQRINGISYSTEIYKIEVTVTDNYNGTLSASTVIRNSNNEVVSQEVFVNTYTTDSVTTERIMGTKTLFGRDMAANEFAFHFYKTDETFAIPNGVAPVYTTYNDARANGIADDLSFVALTFDTVGKYYFTVVEDQTPIDGVTLDTSKFNITIEVVDDTNGKLVVKELLVNGSANNEIAFVNTYTIDPTPFEFGGYKTLTGRDLAADEFTFNLYESDVTFANRNFVTSVKNTEGGSFMFTGLEKAVGTYYYVVEEAAGTVGGVTYDATHYHVTVEVVDNGVGGTTANVKEILKVTKNEEGTVIAGSNVISFVNKYVPVDNDGIVIGGNKTLTGRHTIDGEFTFELYEADENYTIAEGAKPIRTVNEANTFAFEEVYFDKVGDYYFVVKELDKNAGGMTYDTASFRVHVTVTDDGKGELHAAIVSINDQANGTITFNNEYTINDQEEFVISGVKEFTGRDWTDNDVFTFELYETNDKYEVSGATLLETKTATKGNVNFSFSKFVYKAEETHYYVVRELAGASDNGITYDTKEYQIKVVVTDNHDGTLSLTSKTVVAGTEVTNIKFTNTYEVFDNSAAFVDIEATKTLTGRSLKNAEFTFELYEATYNEATGTITKGNLVETVKNANTAVKFSRIEFTEEGTYHYIVKEQVGASNVGITYDSTEYLVTIVVYDDGNGRLAVNKRVNGEVGSITINNTYTVTPDTFDLSGTKTLTGRDMVADEFEFSLYQATDSTYANRTLVKTVKNDAAGKFEFTGLSEQAGTYYYVIEEKQGSKGGVTYDASHYHVVVTIVDNGLGTTEVSSITYEVVEENGKVEDASAVTFNNTYTPTDSVGLVLGGNKALAGRHTIDGEFTFELYKTGADFELVEGVAPIQTVNEDDKFEFKPLTYQTTGTHYYVIKELDKNAGGMTYDTASYRITVEVTDDLNGELVAKVVSMTDANGKAVEEINFNNSYKIEKPNKVVFDGNKVLRGREWLDTDVFTFELYEANANYVVADGAKPVDTQTATKGNTAFVFDEISYNAEATHYYVVKEVVGTLGGITYDTTVYNVKVVVTDNHDGTLSVEKTYYADGSKVDAIEFVNTYEVLDSSKAYATIRGTKSLSGRPLANGEFAFELYSATYDAETKQYVAGELKETVTNTAAAFTFSTMEYSEVGTHYYVVKEKVGELGGITYDETEYVIEVKVTDGYDGKLYSSVAIINSEATVVAFNNTYTIYPDTFSFEAVKTLTGREMNDGEFSFELYETNSSYKDAKLVQTVKNDKAGKVEFAGLSKYPGTYYYVIKEVAGTKGGVSYDSSYYQVKIVIVDEGNGTTKIENTTITKVSITDNGAVSESADKVAFANTYTPTDSDGIVIEGNKKLTGRHMINGEFAFELYDEEGTLKQTVVNKDGKFAFSPLFFEEVGTYTYTVKEKDLNAGGMSYDAKEFVVVIKVTDDLNGELVATVDSINGSKNAVVEFNNSYEIVTPNSTIIEGYKTFTGREWTDEDVFTFELYETGSDYVVADGARPMDTETATKGNTAFAFDEIKYNAEKTHYYVVKEVVGDTTVGITYDASVYNVKVDVVDLHDGTLSVTQTVSKANTVVEEIEFVNTYEVYEGAYAQATISGIKTLTTRPIKDAEFTFDLYETGSDFTIVAGSTPIQTVNDGVTFTFETIKYDKIGTYYYVVKEMNAGQTINGVTYDAREHKVQVDVTDGGKGYLVSKVTVIGTADNTLVVDNKYTITPTEFSLEGTKALSGRDMNAGEFTFELYEANRSFVEGDLVQTVTNAKDGSFEFTGLKQQPGTYYYVIKEKAGSKGGVTYDTAKYQVTVTVKDDELGGTVVTNRSYVKVTANGSTTANEVEFNNTYAPKDTEGLVVGGIKLLTGRNLVNGEFVFELYNETGELLLQTTVNKDGKFAFAELKYEEVGTYVYTIKERDNGIGGITYDPTVFTVTVEVVDDLNGELVATVTSIKASNKAVDTMIFENTYKAKPISNTIDGIKVVTGREWLDSDVFTFELYETASDYVISGDAIDTATATKDNQAFAFDEITYDTQDVYYYVVKEVAGTIGGVTYDVRLYNLKVTVTDMLDGTFTLEQEVVVDGEVAEKVEFVNPYKASATGLTLFAQKEIDGRDLVEAEFSFELYEASEEFVVSGAAIQTKENTAEGAVTFDELTYEEAGTYYYVVAEKVGTLGGVTYDETKYFVTVEVTDDLEGQLHAEIASIMTNNSEEATDNVVFNNTYVPAPTVDGIILTATKIFNGRELTEGLFTFNLFQTDETYVINSVALQTATNDALGFVTFEEMQYETAGSYYYVINEENDGRKNIIYDTSSYMIEVKVTDDLQGQLHAEVVSITKDGEVVEEVVFENTYFVNTADTATANGYLATMFASAIALIIAISKKRKLSK